MLLVPPQLRPLLARYARLFAPGLHVLSYNEVPDELELKIMGGVELMGDSFSMLCST